MLWFQNVLQAKVMLLLDLGKQYGWDELVGFVAIFKIWLIEFEKIDLDGDRAISILFDQYIITLARCWPGL